MLRPPDAATGALADPGVPPDRGPRCRAIVDSAFGLLLRPTPCAPGCSGHDSPARRPLVRLNCRRITAALVSWACTKHALTPEPRCAVTLQGASAAWQPVPRCPDPTPASNRMTYLPFPARHPNTLPIQGRDERFPSTACFVGPQPTMHAVEMGKPVDKSVDARSASPRRRRR